MSNNMRGIFSMHVFMLSNKPESKITQSIHRGLKGYLLLVVSLSCTLKLVIRET